MRSISFVARCAASCLILMGASAAPSWALAQALPTPAGQVRVVIQNYAFHPATLRIAPGTTVTWVNEDEDVHTVVNSDHDRVFSSPPLNTGQSFSHTFDVAGIYHYVCSVHPFMTGQIVVQPHP